MRRYTKLLAAATMSGMLFFGSPATAATSAAFITAGDSADAPEGFVEMCARDQQLCNAGLTHAVATTTALPVGCTDAAAYSVFDLVHFLLAGPGLTPTSDPLGAATPTCTAPRVTIAAHPAAVLPTIAVAAPLPIIGMPASLQGFGTATVRDDRTIVAKSRRARGKQKESPEFALVRAINGRVNRQVVQASDMVSAGVAERWNRVGEKGHPMGDCEDIAIEKRARLLEAGFAPDKLFYAVVYRAKFGLHTLLIARLPEGDIVLDSARQQIVRWDEAPYSWIRVQSTYDPMVWNRVAPTAQS